MCITDAAEGLLRRLAPQVLGTLVRRYGDFDACEDTVQEALLAAAVQWPGQAIPDHPATWLITAATRRLCACRKRHPRSSSGMRVFVEDSTESVSSAYVRHDCTHRSITAFIRGIRTPVSTAWMPTSVRISSMSAGNFPTRSPIR
ncbi:sigma-70-like protein [Nonomuraea polychroma]|uniref:Sigma-70-like protein n=1 Tax=Nonomuraea polychroma TaxID=46176 RepID=A0A438LZV1_9ACTN|nr:sigma-70-like protein [Nonomuraea polychroma]